jgi:hypothetical protein
MTGFGGLEKNYEKNPDGSNNLDKQIPNTPQQIAAYKKAHPQNLDEKGNIKDISSIYALMEKLGEKLGGPLGDIIQHFINWLNKLEPAQIDAGVKSLEAFIIAIGGIISTTVNMFTDTSSVIGPAGAALLFIGGTKFITSLLGNIAGKFMGGATAAATASTAGGVLSRAQGLKAAGFGGLFVGMLTAYGSEILFNSVLDSVVSDDNPMKANIKKYGDIIAPIVGGLFGPMLIRGIVAILVEGALIPALAGITTVALIAAIAIYMNQKNNEKIDEAAAKRGYYPAPPSAFTPYNEYDPDNGYVNKNGKTLSRQQSNPAFEDARKNLYEKRLKENRINPKTNKPYTPKEIHDDIWGEDDTTGTKSDAGGWTVTPTDNSKMVPIEIDGKKALVNPLAQKAFQSILDEGHRLGYHWSSLGGWAASGHVPGSHHYDGTAFDGNPATNPYGPPGGPLVTDMPKALIDFAEKIPGIHWGGRFSNRKDAMHFEYHPGEVGLAPNTPPSKLASNTSEEPHYINKPAMPEPNTPEPETSMEQLRLQNDDLTEKWTAEKEFSHHKKEYLEKVRGSTGLHGDVYTDNENWVMLLKDMRDLHRQQLAVQAKMAKEQERTTDAAKGAPIVGRGK